MPSCTLSYPVCLYLPIPYRTSGTLQYPTVPTPTLPYLPYPPLSTCTFPYPRAPLVTYHTIRYLTVPTTTLPYLPYPPYPPVTCTLLYCTLPYPLNLPKRNKLKRTLKNFRIRNLKNSTCTPKRQLNSNPKKYKLDQAVIFTLIKVKKSILIP